jgi:predicted extracellular nuclease
MAGATRARVKDLYVIGIRASSGGRGFYAQLDNGNLPFSGLYVETGAASPTVAIGNKVDVEGDYVELFGVTTLKNPIITVTGLGTTLPFGPKLFTAADITNVLTVQGASAEGYEGQLCQVDTVTVSIMNSDGAAGDYDEFSVTDASGGVLRVDDYLYEALDNTYAVSTAFPKVLGVCGWSFSNRKIYPRSAVDLQ